eukprot:2022052-Rhodomonas_salina.1
MTPAIRDATRPQDATTSEPWPFLRSELNLLLEPTIVRWGGFRLNVALLSETCVLLFTIRYEPSHPTLFPVPGPRLHGALSECCTRRKFKSDAEPATEKGLPVLGPQSTWR